MRAVIDTNVLFRGMTAPGSEAGGVLAAWLENRFRPCVSTALVLLRELLRHAHHTVIRISTRPLSPDPDDDFLIDCAFNAQAAIVTENVRDFRTVQAVLGLPALTARAFLDLV